MTDDKTLDFNPDDERPSGPEPAPAAAPEQIGPYRLVREIGEGGMGLVYEAEQLEPIRRKVALKMVKRGMDTEEFVTRFESERQALAMMDHPCIAKVFDAGATESGRPYFVMEYVEGIPINHYCDENKLSLTERLELLIHVCEGVQHAHQKAIIHRDLKPSNVLVAAVDGLAHPKIIDFGVAKAMDQSLFSSTMTTSAGQLIGTPEYMSPEQADMTGQGIDTRTDVYALGVILYEMLAGRLPLTSEDMKEMGFQEALRTIREVEPPKPSTRVRSMYRDEKDSLSIVAGNRTVSIGDLGRKLRGDLDWITMKALEKDRVRRYETASSLALDLRRYLNYEPVSAGPPSASYRIRKFVRRHRTGVAAAAFVLVAVLLGIAGTTTGMIRAVRAERRARLEAETASQVSDFLVDLFEVSDPDQSRGNTITAREILDRGSERIEKELQDQPATQARLMNTMGKVYQNLGLFDEAAPKLESALELHRNLPVVDDNTLASSLADLADLYIYQARYAEAETLLQKALDVGDVELDADRLRLAASLNDLASIYRRQGRYDEAEPLYLRARNIRVAVLGKDDPEVARSYNSLAILNWNRGNYDQAERLYKQALALWEKAYGTNHADVAKGWNNLALLYHHQDLYDKAEPLYRRAAAIYEEVLGPDHPRLAAAINNLALVLYEQGEYEESETLFERALDIKEQVLGAEHPDVARILNNLANLYRKRKEYGKARPLYERALAIREASLGADHPDVGWSLRDLALLSKYSGDFDAAAVHMDRAVELFKPSLGTDHPDLIEVYEDYAAIMRDLGRQAAADSLTSLVRDIREANR